MELNNCSQICQYGSWGGRGRRKDHLCYFLAIIWHLKRELFVSAILYNSQESGKHANAACCRLQIAANGRRNWFLVMRGWILTIEILKVCYLFCCSKCYVVSSFKVCGKKFDRSDYFLLGAYFSRILNALFGGIQVWEEVGWVNIN